MEHAQFISLWIGTSYRNTRTMSIHTYTRPYCIMVSQRRHIPTHTNTQTHAHRHTYIRVGRAIRVLQIYRTKIVMWDGGGDGGEEWFVVSESGALGRLGELAIVKRGHLTRNKKKVILFNRVSGERGGGGPADFDKDSLDALVAIPIGENRQLGRVDFTVDLRDEREVDARDELDHRWLIRVVIAAVYLERVDTILVHRLCVFQGGLGRGECVRGKIGTGRAGARAACTTEVCVYACVSYVG
jgi:hypothetical protein